MNNIFSTGCVTVWYTWKRWDLFWGKVRKQTEVMTLSDIFLCEISLNEQDICEIDMSLSFWEGMTMSFLSIKVEYI